MQLASPQTLQQATDYLASRDRSLAQVIIAIGPCPIEPHGRYYERLVQSILSQQLSIKAAAAIEAKFIALFGGAFPTPEQLLESSVDELRSAGLSRAKAAYIQDLAAHVVDGRIHFEHLDGLSNDEIVTELTAVKGIGEWTVHMFLIFCLGRLDVLPTGDLGIKNGVRRLYGLAGQPTAQDVAAVAAAHQWHPYESVASWYVWQSLTLPAAT